MSFVGAVSKVGGSNQLWDAQQRELGAPIPVRVLLCVCLTLSFLHSLVPVLSTHLRQEWG